MGIYEPEGSTAIVDLRAAAKELRAAGSITNADTRRAVVAEITAATLLDIALSLRYVGAEALAAIPVYATELDGPAETPDEPEHADDFFVVGDLVHLDADTEPGEIVKILVTEGEVAADVAFASGYTMRHFTRDLVRLVGDDAPEPDAGTPLPIADDDVNTHEGEPGGLAELEPEDDFEPPVTALDVLDAKPAKKKGGKK
jgi:hypothetical protein